MPQTPPIQLSNELAVLDALGFGLYLHDLWKMANEATEPEGQVRCTLERFPCVLADKTRLFRVVVTGNYSREMLVYTVWCPTCQKQVDPETECLRRLRVQNPQIEEIREYQSGERLILLPTTDDPTTAEAGERLLELIRYEVEELEKDRECSSCGNKRRNEAVEKHLEPYRRPLDPRVLDRRWD